MYRQRLPRGTFPAAFLIFVGAPHLAWAATCSNANGHITVNCTDLAVVTVPRTITVDNGATVSNQASSQAVLSDSSTAFTFTNNGTISGSGGGIYNSSSIVPSLMNAGHITVNDDGIYNADSQVTELSNSGDITSAVGDGINNQGASNITTLTNSGTITSLNLNGIENTNSGPDTLNIGMLTNSGTVSGSDVGVYNGQFGGGNYTIGSIVNTGTGVITGTYGLINQNAGFGNFSLGTLNNAGHITGVDGEGIYNENSGPGTFIIHEIDNSGTITGTNASGIYNASATIGTITNTGTITGTGPGSFGISNNTDFNVQPAVIGTLNNLQGGNTPLTYHGSLPGHYNVIINSHSNYGKLVLDSPTGSTNFGIYTGSTVSPGTYAGVLSGLTPSSIVNLSGAYGGYQWTLDEVGTSEVWDLVFLSNGPFGPSVSDVQASVNALGASERNMLVGSRSTANEIMGMTRPVNEESYTYAGGMFGSAVGYVGGQYSASHGVTVLGGIAYGKQDYANVEQSSSTTLAIAGRYTFGEEGNRLRPFAELGTWVTPDSDLKLSRAYMNNNAEQEGTGSATSTSWAEYARIGLAADVTAHNQLTGYAEFGMQSARFGGYTEDAAAGNPFPATVGGGTLSMDVMRFGGSDTYRFDSIPSRSIASVPISLTVAGAIVHSVDVKSGLSASVAGAGTVTAANEDDTWAEFGARIEGQVTNSLAVDLDMSGTSGMSGNLRTSIHGGVGVTYKY